MMDRTALLHRAAEVRRRIFASLPFALRLAIVFTQIAAESGYLFKAWGKLIGHYMLAAGVSGMPAPGEHYKPDAKDPSRTLPDGYMQSFMSNVYGLLIKSWHDPYIAQSAIQDFFAKLAEGKVKLQPLPLSSAESFVRHGIVFEAKSLVRKKLREQAREESLEDTDEDSPGVRRDIADPHSMPGQDDEESDELAPTEMWSKWMHYLEQHKNDMTPRAWSAMVGFLAKKHPDIKREWMDFLGKHIHPDMPLYFQLRLEGYPSADIVGGGKKNKPTMLKNYEPKAYDPVYWDKTYNRQLIPKSVEFFEKMHERVEDAPAPPV